MDKKEIFNRIEYVVACVGAFALKYGLSNSQAYAYLRRFTGIDFLLDCYAAEQYNGDHAVQYFFGTLRSLKLLKRIDL
ncbi:MAG: DUF3791 domain-containing protein [Muribaculaceae bacterium]|nr:DUF3791 domain-containing protein [Muribaculaceae bacterium]